jgi:hypothetical protein
MKTEQNWACPFCDETIKATAKVCPRCRQPLSLRSIRHPVTAFLVLTLPTLLFIILLVVSMVSGLDRIFNPKPSYTGYLGSLQVTESRMNWVYSSNGLHGYVVGIVTNQSQIAWKGIEFDCRFFNTNGILVDAAGGTSPYTIEPHDESAFRVTIYPTRPTNDYASCALTRA